MKNGQDIFRENTLYFFLYCEENCCNWLMKEYSNIRNEYFKSMLCLVIGFRGDVEMLSGVEEILASDHHGKVKQNAQGTDAEQPRQEFGREQKIAFPVHDIHNTPAFRV